LSAFRYRSGWNTCCSSCRAARRRSLAHTQHRHRTAADAAGDVGVHHACMRDVAIGVCSECTCDAAQTLCLLVEASTAPAVACVHCCHCLTCCCCCRCCHCKCACACPLLFCVAQVCGECAENAPKGR
jgi:hypothetical protein